MTSATYPAGTPGTPYQASPAALGKATLWAGIAAAAILTLFVLPAEWGIDPTGVGKALGLTRMAGGAEADETDSPEVAAAAKATSTLAVPDQSKLNIEARQALRSDEKTLTLPPHSGVEIKAHMVKGDHLIFEWSSTGPIRMDMHGEPKGGKDGEFTSYWKQKDMSGAKGSFTAPFEGTHGWYWRNGGETPVTIKLKTSGFYQDLFEPAE
ncbi:hypothetical protein [Novosphingobium resinovorum]|uniref:Transmembrane anchor protein n=1 Tax=Novosphingobium resinovorum TaxID=158500 RepID=A0A1D8A2U8_9SPHN|nr:hypothetical protein [Novosphingobium resinovorum]AOR76437.1 hypothetical protein BES08_06475 [Novosphingobium resinovorum]